jgi:hypothetical protein
MFRYLAYFIFIALLILAFSAPVTAFAASVDVPEPKRPLAELAALAPERTQQLTQWLERGIAFAGHGWSADTLGIALDGLEAMLDRHNRDWSRLQQVLGLAAHASLVYDGDTSRCESGPRANCADPWRSRIYFNTDSLTLTEFLHENGHIVDWNLQDDGHASGRWWSETGLRGLGWEKGWIEVEMAHRRGYVYDDAGRDAPYSTASIQEDFADTFVAWVLDPNPPAPYRLLSERRREALNQALLFAE